MYESKLQSYFSAARHEVLDLAPDFSRNVLEIGCGTGETLLLLKRNGRCLNTVGVELFENAAEEAKKVVDTVLNIDVEKNSLNGVYDLIIIMDVLEHLVDPWSLLERLVRENMASGGVLISSIPNIRHYSVIFGILQGDFNYSLSGILDKTHLRFFTKKSMQLLYESAGLEITKCIGTGLKKSIKSKVFNFLTFGLFSDFFCIQYVMKCKKKQGEVQRQLHCDN